MPPKRSTPSPTKPKPLTSLLHRLNIRKTKGLPEPTSPPPQVIQYHTSSRPVNEQELASAPDLGDGGWGERSWQRVRRNGHAGVDERVMDWQDGHDEADISTERNSGASFDIADKRGRSISSSKSLNQTRHKTSITPPPRKLTPYPTTTPRRPTPQTPFTPPNRKSAPSHRGRTASIASASSSTRTHTPPAHRTPSGSSYTAQGINVRALPARRTTSGGSSGATYTAQGVRVGSDGYVGKWRSAKKADGEAGVWKGHPALQPRPDGGGGN